MTWESKPGIGAALADLPNPVSSGAWTQAVLPSFVTGNGTYDIYVTSASADAAYYASSEARGTPPTLVVAWGGSPGPTPTPTPTSPPAPTPTPTPAPPSANPVIVAAGDIACEPGKAPTSSTCRQKFVADRITAINPQAVLLLGDNQYYCGSLSEFKGSYDLSWGKFKSKTRPAIGNHEYITAGVNGKGPTCTSANAGARGYFDYFTRGRASPLDTNSACSTPGHAKCKGYYSYNIGKWHLIALNSNCGDAGGCSSGSPQHTWLKQDLAANPNNAFKCTLAYWHIPMFSSGPRNSPNATSLFKLLYDANAEVVLNGHEHNYERFAPQTSTGAADSARGLRQFIVGTGGANFTSFGPIAANSQFRDSSHYGVLKLTLKADSYDWQYVGENGTVYDSGNTKCH